MRVMLLGGPGAGKGTQAQHVIKYFNIPQISTGDMLRSAVSENTEFGVKAQEYMNQGLLVPDDLIIAMVKLRLQDSDQGYLLDGFPRTLIQAKAMVNAQIELDHVIEIQVPDEEIIKRICGRRVHPTSGRVYHVDFQPSKEAGKDDLTGDLLIQREDDKEDVIKRRLAVYHEQTTPLIDFYRHQIKTLSGVTTIPQYHIINGIGNVDDIGKKIINAITIGK